MTSSAASAVVHSRTPNRCPLQKVGKDLAVQPAIFHQERHELRHE